MPRSPDEREAIASVTRRQLPARTASNLARTFMVVPKAPRKASARVRVVSLVVRDARGRSQDRDEAAERRDKVRPKIVYRRRSAAAAAVAAQATSRSQKRVATSRAEELACGALGLPNLTLQARFNCEEWSVDASRLCGVLRVAHCMLDPADFAAFKAVLRRLLRSKLCELAVRLCMIEMAMIEGLRSATPLLQRVPGLLSYRRNRKGGTSEAASGAATRSVIGSAATERRRGSVASE